MKTIWKYPLKVVDEQIVAVPWGADILCVQTQNDLPCLWAKVNAQFVRETYIRVVMVGTGNPADDTDDMRYLGTFQMYGGELVFHVFVLEIPPHEAKTMPESLVSYPRDLGVFARA